MNYSIFTQKSQALKYTKPRGKTLSNCHLRRFCFLLNERSDPRSRCADRRELCSRRAAVGGCFDAKRQNVCAPPSVFECPSAVRSTAWGAKKRSPASQQLNRPAHTKTRREVRGASDSKNNCLCHSIFNQYAEINLW